MGDGTTVWQLAAIRETATVGRNCIIGRGAYVDEGVVLGDNVKLQNHALVYAPARLEDGSFVGPAAVLTNDSYPRSVTTDGRLKRADDWAAKGVVVREGGAIGPRAVVLGGVTIGRWAMVGPAPWLPETYLTTPWFSACRRGRWAGWDGRRAAAAAGRRSLAVPGDRRRVRRTGSAPRTCVTSRVSFARQLRRRMWPSCRVSVERAARTSHSVALKSGRAGGNGPSCGSRCRRGRLAGAGWVRPRRSR